MRTMKFWEVKYIVLILWPIKGRGVFKLVFPIAKPVGHWCSTKPFINIILYGKVLSSFAQHSGTICILRLFLSLGAILWGKELILLFCCRRYGINEMMSLECGFKTVWAHEWKQKI